MVPIDAWIVADRKVKTGKYSQDKDLPFSISQNYRRITQNLMAGLSLPAKETLPVPAKPVKNKNNN